MLAAETRREMEEWIAALKSANTTTHYYEVSEGGREGSKGGLGGKGTGALDLEGVKDRCVIGRINRVVEVKEG